MPRISRKKLPENSRLQLWDNFIHAFSSLQGKRSFDDLLFDLLTPAERVMLSKRLAIALLLEQGYSFLDISKNLNVSTTTIGAVKQELLRSGSGYRALAESLRTGEREKQLKKSESENRKKRIDAFLRSLIPPVKGSRKSFKQWQRNLKRFSRP